MIGRMAPRILLLLTLASCAASPPDDGAPAAGGDDAAPASRSPGHPLAADAGAAGDAWAGFPTWSAARSYRHYEMVSNYGRVFMCWPGDPDLHLSCHLPDYEPGRPDGPWWTRAWTERAADGGELPPRDAGAALVDAKPAAPPPDAGAPDSGRDCAGVAAWSPTETYPRGAHVTNVGKLFMCNIGSAATCKVGVAPPASGWQDQGACSR